MLRLDFPDQPNGDLELAAWHYSAKISPFEQGIDQLIQRYPNLTIHAYEYKPDSIEVVPIAYSGVGTRSLSYHLSPSGFFIFGLDEGPNDSAQTVKVATGEYFGVFEFNGMITAVVIDIGDVTLLDTALVVLKSDLNFLPEIDATGDRIQNDTVMNAFDTSEDTRGLLDIRFFKINVIGTASICVNSNEFSLHVRKSGETITNIDPLDHHAAEISDMHRHLAAINGSLSETIEFREQLDDLRQNLHPRCSLWAFSPLEGSRCAYIQGELSEAGFIDDLPYFVLGDENQSTIYRIASGPNFTCVINGHDPLIIVSPGFKLNELMTALSALCDPRLAQFVPLNQKRSLIVNQTHINFLTTHVDGRLGIACTPSDGYVAYPLDDSDRHTILASYQIGDDSEKSFDLIQLSRTLEKILTNEERATATPPSSLP